jgi:hypothetical protein
MTGEERRRLWDQWVERRKARKRQLLGEVLTLMPTIDLDLLSAAMPADVLEVLWRAIVVVAGRPLEIEPWEPPPFRGAALPRLAYQRGGGWRYDE